MIFTEWNWEDAIEIAKEESKEEGREEIFALLDSDTLAEVKQKLRAKN